MYIVQDQIHAITIHLSIVIEVTISHVCQCAYNNHHVVGAVYAKYGPCAVLQKTRSSPRF